MEQPSPQILKSYDAWVNEALEAERPVYLTLGFLLSYLTGLGVILSGLIALVVVVGGTTIGRLAWIRAHLDEFPDPA